MVAAVLSKGCVSFDVESVEGSFDQDGKWEGRYIVLIYCSWFSHLATVANDLAKIEKELE